MSNDSITSSPSKSNKSIHKVRLLRKNKRKKVNQSVHNHDHKETKMSKFLYDFYKNSENELEDTDKHNTFIVSRPAAIVKNYKPFENEKCLAVADRLSSNQQDIRRKEIEFPGTPEIFTCQLPNENEEKTPVASISIKKDSSFLITESELVNCCNQAEKVFKGSFQKNMELENSSSFLDNKPNSLENKMELENSILRDFSQTEVNEEPHSPQHEFELVNSILRDFAQSPLTKDFSQTSLDIEPDSPKHEFELVNSILKDFSQSPLTKEQSLINTSWQYTPEFRLRRKPIKTYSRKALNCTRTNLSKRLDYVASDDEDGKSNCSSLSTQENTAPLEGVSNHNVSLTNTSQICQNLLNLSAFFSQNSSEIINTSETCLNACTQERLLPSERMLDIMQDIFTQRSTCPYKLRSNSYKSNEDFCGFADHNEEENAIDLLAIEDEQESLNLTLIVHKDMKPLEEQTMNKSPKAADFESIQIDLDRHLDTKDYNDWNEDGFEDVFACINSDDILLKDKTSTNLPKTPSKSANNADKPPKIIEKCGKMISHECVQQDQISTNFMGFKTASSKAIEVSREAHIIAAKILSKLPDINFKSKTNDCDNRVIERDCKTNTDVNIFENLEDYEWNDDCDFFLNFQTPATLKVKTPNNLQYNEEKVTSTFSYTNDKPSTSKMALKANIEFQIARAKNVSISEKAPESVEKLLPEFATDTHENLDCDELKEMKTKIDTKLHNRNRINNEEKIDKENCDNEYLKKSLKNATTLIEDWNRQDKLVDFKETNPQSVISNTILNGSVGFQTGKGKIFLNEYSVDPNQNLENDLEEIIQQKNKKTQKIKPEIYKTISDKCTLQQKIPQSKDSNEVFNKHEGFLTANGKQVQVSLKAQLSAKKLLDEFHTNINDNFENNLELMKNQIYTKNSNAAQKQTIEFQQLSNSHSLLMENNGFQTANGKKLKISAKAQQSVEKLLKDFNTDSNVNFIQDLETIKNDINKKCNKPQFSKLTNCEDVNRQFSENNKDLANMVLSEWPLSNHTHISNSENTKILKTDNIQDLKKRKEACLKVQENNDVPERYHNNSGILKTYNIDTQKSTNIGFQTANGKKVSISAKAQQAVDKLLQEFRTDLNDNNYDQNLMEIKSNIELKNKQFKQTNNKSNPKPSPEKNEYANMVLSEWPLSSRKELTQNDTPTQIMGKRKLSIDNSDIPSPIALRSPPTKIINKGLYSTKTSFSELAINSPLQSSPASSIISRKNLLSLNKRRKQKRNSVANINQDNSRTNEKEIPKINKEFVATPIKSSIMLRSSIQTPGTPNLIEFFSNAPQTSTPRVEKLSQSPQITMDVDFKPITWDNNNDSTVNKSLSNLNHTTKLSDSTCSNTTINSSNPSAKDRIARLKMYGKAPAVSPILIETQNNCRPSGLRRTRSMLKKPENK